MSMDDTSPMEQGTTGESPSEMEEAMADASAESADEAEGMPADEAMMQEQQMAEQVPPDEGDPELMGPETEPLPEPELEPESAMDGAEYADGQEPAMADPATEPSESVPEPDDAEPPAELAEAYLTRVDQAEYEVAAATLEAHRYAALFPPMRPGEFSDLCDAIAAHGQQVAAVELNGLLLDGRNRDRACDALGIPLRVASYTGTDAQALSYVLNANQHRRDLTKSQRAAVAATLVPLFAGDVAAERIRKIRESRLAALSWEIPVKVSGSSPDDPEASSARGLAAKCMQVSPAYVQRAIRIQRERPDLFEQVWNGSMNIPTALKEMDPPASPAVTARATSARSRVASFLRLGQENLAFLEELEELLLRHKAESE